VVTVRSIAAGGSGVADLPDGRVVFVPRTAPGDRARIRIEKSRPRWAEGSLCELVEPAAGRRAALCPLYVRCGGCQLQHLSYPDQIEWKGRIVADALARIGRVGGLAVPGVVGSPREVGYRSRISFTLRRLRGGRVAAGLHALGRPGRVIDVGGECVLPRPELVSAWTDLRGAWGPGARRLPEGGRLRLTLRAEPRGVELVVDGGRSGWRAGELAAAAPALQAIWHRSAEGAAPRLVAGSSGAVAAPAFTQVNPEAAALLVTHVLDTVGDARPGEGARGADAVDAYCGDGPYAVGLLERGWRVRAIEVDPAACAAARERAGGGRSGTLEVLEGGVEARLPEALPADVVIVNPPRSGLGSGVVDILRNRRVPRLVYVSCDPATLARDVAALGPGYAPRSIRCFDLFPQTAHVETVLALCASEG
jgi:23S rRNA (uracil1939-C5)-methyltransferase